MKKRKLSNKLVFRKETITSLNDMQNIKGGEDEATLSLWSCNTKNKPCGDDCYFWRTSPIDPKCNPDD